MSNNENHYDFSGTGIEIAVCEDMHADLIGRAVEQGVEEFAAAWQDWIAPDSLDLDDLDRFRALLREFTGRALPVLLADLAKRIEAKARREWPGMSDYAKCVNGGLGAAAEIVRSFAAEVQP